jgi:hypothetical protein
MLAPQVTTSPRVAEGVARILAPQIEGSGDEEQRPLREDEASERAAEGQSSNLRRR